MNKEISEKRLIVAILSLSLLTVMAGAAVAPALNVIKDYFSDTSQALIQMIVSIPSLFIALTSLVFPRLCHTFRSRTLVLIGLTFYVAGGTVAGVFDNIYLVLAFRALVGIGVGIIMPLSTGLLSFYFSAERLDSLIGYSSAMNQMGGVVSTLLSGILAGISWRASFLVYLLGLFSFVLCLLFLPNEKIRHKEDSGLQHDGPRKNIRSYFFHILSIFLLLLTFFVYPSSFALETAKEGVIPQAAIAVIMAGMDLVAFLGGLSFAHMKRNVGKSIRFLSPLLFLVGYCILFLVGGWPGAVIGSALVGFANGSGIPFIISDASQKAGRLAAATVMPLLTMAMNLGQFVTPLILSLGSTLLADAQVVRLPYLIAMAMAVVLGLSSSRLK